MGWLLDSFGNIWGKTVPIRSWLDDVWKSPWMGAALLLGSWAVAIYWLFSTPSPGKSVGALAVVATVMTFRGELSGVEKTFLTLVLFLFVFVEIKAIDKDRDDSNAQALKDRNAQDLAFKGVRDQQDTDFKVTAGGLQTAIDALNKTLTSSQQAALTSIQIKQQNEEKQERDDRELCLETKRVEMEAGERAFGMGGFTRLITKARQAKDDAWMKEEMTAANAYFLDRLQPDLRALADKMGARLKTSEPPRHGYLKNVLNDLEFNPEDIRGAFKELDDMTQQICPVPKQP